MRLVISFFLLIALMGLAGCFGGKATTPGGPAGVPVETIGAAPPSKESRAGEGPTTWGVGGRVSYPGSPLKEPANLLSRRVFYFAFDSSEIRPSDRPSIEAHGAYLARHPGAEVIVAGHTDERGTREYNLALGLRRAKAVRHVFLLMGASPDQIQIVSYGEERPAVKGHNERAWKFNRRVELHYTDGAPAALK